MSIRHAPNGRSASLSHDSLTDVPADKQIRPLRDWMVVQPLEAKLSTVLYVHNTARPVRGIVKAVGPGCYPKRYDHPDKHKRTKMWASRAFRPTEVKVGDVVELGGIDLGGYAFQAFRWGDVTHILCREEDVSGVLNVGAENEREEARRVAA
jgi:co-chaperonin GroES (HSP10)